MDLEKTLYYLNNLSGIPISYVKNENETLYIPELPYLPNLSLRLPIGVENSSAQCFTMDEQVCYGYIGLKGSSSYLIIGPAIPITCENKMAQYILKKLELPTTDAGKLISYFNSIPLCPISKFANFILFTNYIVNQELLDITQLLPSDYIFQEEKLQEFTIKEDLNTIHDAFAYEEKLFSLIRFGLYNEMMDFIKKSTFQGNEGALAHDILRHRKNLIISSVTLAARSAVDGGLDYATSMRLADAYIQKAELAPDTNALYSLHKNMLLTYTRLVSERKVNDAHSALSMKVQNYINQHITEKITGNQIAEALQLNRSYLSHQFKLETGINLNDFVNQVKVDEAKKLLITTNSPITDISTLLAFSSQSYFQTIFKKFTGKTPLEFREDN